LRITFSYILFSFLSVCIGIVFLLSGISKIPSLEPFGWSIVEISFLPWGIAEWLARLLIGAELFLGILFLIQVRLKKIAIPLAIFLLSIFSAYLILLIRDYGAQGNCGCFGEWIPMSPKQSLLKNIILLGCIVLLSIWQDKRIVKRANILVGGLALSFLILPFLLSPPESIYIYPKDPSKNRVIPLHYLYQSKSNTHPKIDLRKGKHIVLFLSLQCGYCKKAAKKMGIIQRKFPSFPLYAIINGDTSLLQTFMIETRLAPIPFTHFNGANEFMEMNGSAMLPSIQWVKDTVVVRESNYVNISETEIEQWLMK
jgi:uncharacterized membrane protein YphA (DoxX/SURF4 family)